MDVLRDIITALLQDKPLSNRAIANRVGCERRRVARYRRLLNGQGLTLAHLDGLDGRVLSRLLNRRARAPRRTPPDFRSLISAYPGASSRFLYSCYIEDTRAHGGHALRRSRFNEARSRFEAAQRARRHALAGERPHPVVPFPRPRS